MIFKMIVMRLAQILIVYIYSSKKTRQLGNVIILENMPNPRNELKEGGI